MLYDFEANADYEVVWDGGELLPPRDSAIDRTWDDCEVMVPGSKYDPQGKEFCVVTHPKRRYRKVNHMFWKQRSELPIHCHDERDWGAGHSPLRYRPSHHACQATAQGGGNRRLLLECLQDVVNCQKSADKESSV